MEGGDPVVADDDRDEPAVVGLLPVRTGSPCQTCGGVERLRFAVRRVREKRMGRTQIAAERAQLAIAELPEFVAASYFAGKTLSRLLSNSVCRREDCVS